MTSVPADVGAWLRALADHADLDAAVAEHLAACNERGLMPATLVKKYHALARADRELGGLLEVGEPALRRWWRSTAATRGRAPATRVAERSHIREFFKWCVREELRADDPTMRLDAPRRRRRLPRPADEQAVRRMLADLEGKEWRAVALASLAGLRCAEVAAVRPRHVRFDSEGRATLRVSGKGGHERAVPIPPALARDLAALPPDAPAVPTQYGTAYTPDGMSAALGRLLREHGVQASAHMLRHAFATRAYSATGDLLATQRALGHANPATTAVYADVTGADVRAAVEPLWTDLERETP